MLLFEECRGECGGAQSVESILLPVKENVFMPSACVALDKGLRLPGGAVCMERNRRSLEACRGMRIKGGVGVVRVDMLDIG